MKNLTASQKKELFEGIYYLNIKEYTTLCRELKVPFHICIELPSGKLKKTSERDRKGVVLARLKKFLETGKEQPPTILAKKVVKLEKLSGALKPDDMMYYGQYEKQNPQFMKVLKELTDGTFKDGSIAREVIRDFWTNGKAPTYKQFAKAWMKAENAPIEVHPEWAFLTDRANGVAEKDWKELRNKKAQQVLKTLKGLF